MFAAGCTAGRVCLDSLPHTSTTSTSTIQTVIQIAIAILAAVTLLIITIAGFQYVLSQGDPQKVAKAKNTIIYAVIGLVVAILAQVIVTFVVNGVAK